MTGLAVIPAALGVWATSRHRVIVTNATGQVIRTLQVRINGSTFGFTHIEPGETVSAIFDRPDEDVFGFDWQLADGAEHSDSGGYVVWEDWGRRFHFEIREEGQVYEIRTVPGTLVKDSGRSEKNISRILAWHALPPLGLRF
jgi:hypothetical protein